jgi:hypothetical protein
MSWIIYNSSISKVIIISTKSGSMITILRRKFSLLPYLPVIIMPVILFSGSLFRFEALYWGTAGLQFIPWRVYAWESLSSGSAPLWNHLNGMGAPLAANYQVALFYPPGWSLYLFAAIGGAQAMAWAHTLLLVLHLIWAGLGMVTLLRKLGLGTLAQVIGALAFSMGGYLVARSGFFSMIWVGSWLPWMILTSSQLSNFPGIQPSNAKRKLPYGFVFSTAMLLLAGHAQLAWYILLLTAVWLLTGAITQGGVKTAWLGLVRYVAGVASGAVLAAVQLIPTAEYLLQSQRSKTVDFEAALSYSFWPWRLLTLVAPDLFGNPGHGTFWGYANYWEDALYIGMLPLLLALATLPVLWRKRKEPMKALVRFAWIVTVAGFLLALGKNTPIFPFLYDYVPTFNMFNGPARWLIWSLFGLSLLAAIGVERWRTPTGRGLYWMRLATAGGFAITLGAFLAWAFLSEINSTFIRATAMTGMWALGAGLLTLFIPTSEKNRRFLTWQWLVVFWVGLDLLVAGWRLNPTIRADFFQPNHVWGETDLEGKRVFLSVDEETYLKFRRFFRFEDFRPLEDLVHMKQVLMPNLNLLEGIHSANNFDPMVPGRYARWMQHINKMSYEERQNWLSLMNVGFEQRVDFKEQIGVRFDPVVGGERVRWYPCARSASDGEIALQMLGADIEQSHRDIIILEGEAISEKCNAGSGHGSILSEQSGRIVLQVNADTAGWVFLADTWYPGWSAEVNGNTVPVLRANYLFRAVELEPGFNEVVFVYRPLSVVIGASASLFGWLIILLSIIIWKKSARRFH